MAFQTTRCACHKDEPCQVNGAYARTYVWLQDIMKIWCTKLDIF